jgi:hypothetical protein
MLQKVIWWTYGTRFCRRWPRRGLSTINLHYQYWCSQFTIPMPLPNQLSNLPLYLPKLLFLLHPLRLCSIAQTLPNSSVRPRTSSKRHSLQTITPQPNPV